MSEDNGGRLKPEEVEARKFIAKTAAMFAGAAGLLVGWLFTNWGVFPYVGG
jgi:hypothetical protein